MKLHASFILAVLFPILWTIVFLFENVDRKFTQFMGEHHKYKITGNFHGPRYTWLFNKNHLISGEGGNVSLSLKHSIGEDVRIDDIRIDHVPVFYNSVSVGTPQVYGKVKEYDPNTEDGRFLWYDSVKNRTTIAEKVGDTWTTLYDVEGDTLGALEVLENGYISTLDPDKIYKVVSDVVDDVIAEEPWTSSTGTITRSEIPK